MADAYTCAHGVDVLECSYYTDEAERDLHRATGRAMIEWFNNSDLQMTVRLRKRDDIMTGVRQ